MGITGDVRYVPAAMARAMVAAGSAVVANANGKVKAVRLVAARFQSCLVRTYLPLQGVMVQRLMLLPALPSYRTQKFSSGAHPRARPRRISSRSESPADSLLQTQYQQRRGR